jgi:hypothetical protein
MKVKINTYEIKRIEVEGKEYDLPDEPAYFFETGVRRSVRMIPIWTTWRHEKGESEIIHQYHVTCVYLSFKNKIESFNISAIGGLTDLYNDKDNSEKGSIIKSLFNGWFDVRTKEQFDNDLNTAIHNLNEF